MQNKKDVDRRRSNRHKRQVKRSQEKRMFLWAFIISFTICTLFLARGLVPIGDRTPVPPISGAHMGGSILANPKENALVTGKEQKNEQAWSLILVNKENPIPAQYDVELEQLSNGERIDIRIAPFLQNLFDAARADGVYPIAASGYRTTEKQQKIMDEKIAEYEAKGYSSAQAQAEAEAWVAIPGTSEHQLGIAVDINADGIHSAGNEVYAWLDENAYRFGFIRRYPPDKTDITGVSNEPWHYRYVGITAATEMYQQNLCLEEYLSEEK